MINYATKKEARLKNQNIEIITLESKEVTEIVLPETVKVPKSMILNITNNVNEVTPPTSQKIRTKTHFFVNYAGNNIGGGVRLNAQKRVFASNKGINTIGISLDYSPTFSLNNVNSEMKTTQHELYVGVFAGNEDKWFATASYNLLSNQEYDSMPTVRLAYLHRITKNFYIGPELKVSNTFKYFYPGITLTLG
jgi:hypothetical protein